MEKLQKFSPEKITNDLLPQKFGRRGMIWTVILLFICAIGGFAYIRQLQKGLIVTNMGDYVSWGIYISNFVFFVAISLVGSLITAIFRLSNVPWRTPLTRISEMIAVSAITFAALIIIVDMGRPERLVYLFTHGRIQSPIMWDVIVITTYFCLSLFLLYITLLPDIRIMIDARDKLGKPFSKLYRWLGNFWKGTVQQEKKRDRIITALCISDHSGCILYTYGYLLVIRNYIPPGMGQYQFRRLLCIWCFLVGAGGVVVAMYVFRRVYKLEHYITERHFDKMGRILVMLALLYLYFNINEYLVPAFKMKKPEEEHLTMLFTGEFAPLFWFAIFIGMIIPILIVVFPKGRKPNAMFAAGVMVVIGAWFKRYLIVTPTMLHPFLPKYDAPAKYSHYFPSWEEWAIAFGSLAGVF